MYLLIEIAKQGNLGSETFGFTELENFAGLLEIRASFSYYSFFEFLDLRRLRNGLFEYFDGIEVQLLNLTISNLVEEPVGVELVSEHSSL